jgi:hypothetical protein
MEHSNNSGPYDTGWPFNKLVSEVIVIDVNWLVIITDINDWLE